MPKKKSHHNRLEQQRRVEMAKSFKRLEGLVRAEYPSVKVPLAVYSICLSLCFALCMSVSVCMCLCACMFV